MSANTGSISVPYSISRARAIISKHSSRVNPPSQSSRASRDKFSYKNVDAQIDFERDAGEKVVAVVLHQNGRDMRAPRMTTER